MADKEFIVRKGLVVANTVIVTDGANTKFDTDVLVVDGSNDRVGINTTSPSVSLEIAANDAILIPIGNTAQRPASANGSFRYNTDNGEFEGYANGEWGAIGGGSTYMKGNQGAVGKPEFANNLMRINSNTQSNNITVIAGENALMVGPITIGTGNTLTIDTGARVVIA